MSFIWLARGRSWGFTFLQRAGNTDPLLPYEEAFAGIEDEHEVCRQSVASTALRLLDPENRRDEAGRPIAHDFVLTGDLAQQVVSVEDGIAMVWPLVADQYAAIYDAPKPPSA